VKDGPPVSRSGSLSQCHTHGVVFFFVFFVRYGMYANGVWALLPWQLTFTLVAHPPFKKINKNRAITELKFRVAGLLQLVCSASTLTPFYLHIKH